ncbi:hypothetical protein ACO0SA_001539 [Hanseniaspora valbyensis]
MSQFETANSGVTGTLTVFVHRAKELINVKKMDKQSPFVILRVGHMTCRSKVCFRGGQKPDWSFVAKFQITPEIKPLLDIDCFHETNNAPKFIGKTKVDFTSAIFANEEDGDDRWVELQNGSEYAGKIYLEMSFNLGTTNGNGMMGTDELGNSFSSNGYGDTFNQIYAKNNDLLDDIQFFSQSVSNREIPSLPNANTRGTNNYEGDYQHGVVTSEPEINNYLNNKSVTPSSSRPSSYQFGSSQDSLQRQQYKQAHSSQPQSNYAPAFDTVNTRSNGNNQPSDIQPPSSTGSSASSSEPLFAKLRELKGKMFTFKNQQGYNGATNQDSDDRHMNFGGDNKFNMNNDNRDFYMDHDSNGNNNMSNSKSSKNSQLSKEQMDFQILEKVIGGGVPFEQSTNSEMNDHFNVHDDLPPLPNTKMINNNNYNNNNNYQMGGRIESTRTFSKSRVPSQPMKPIFNMSRRPPPPTK